MHDGLALLGPTLLMTTSATSKHGSEDVIHAATATTTLLDAVLSVFVVELALLLIAENLIG